MNFFKNLFTPAPVVDLNKVITEKNGRLFLNNVPMDKKKLEQLKSEVNFFRNTALWELLTNTLNNQAYEAGWIKSKTFEDLLTGKTISYTISVQKNIIEKIENAI